MKKRIGVFVCHCGINISRTVDVEKVVEKVKELPEVAYADHYTYMCSTPGQQLIEDHIKKEGLTGVVVAACSPRMHETTFRRAGKRAGLNPYVVEIANIREHCSWVHEDKAKGTEKAMDIVRSLIRKVSGDAQLEPIMVPVTKKALVIGAGIGGIQAALDIADGHHKVVMVEREPCIGGRMSQLSETFPTLDCSACILTPKVVDVSQNEDIELHTYSEVVEVSGVIGDFTVKIRKKARLVDLEKCTGCGICTEKCPVVVESEFDRGLGKRKAIFSPFPQAVPNVPVIDQANCIYMKRKKCGVCKKVCEADAVDFEQQDEIIEEKVGAIVVATGFDLLGRDFYGEYGYGQYPDVVDSLQFERMLSASGPSKGDVRRPSDGEVPKEVVWIACVGSRDDSKGISYCSKICCMYTAKQAVLYKHRVHDGQPYVFYMDVRAGGKGYEEFVKRAQVEEGVVYLRGRVSAVYQDGKKLLVHGDDTLSGSQVIISADMVVLACAIRPRATAEQLAQTLRIPYDSDKFYTEAHVKLRPVETNTAGVFLAGVCQGPKDIPETVAQAGCAAAKVLALFSKDEMIHDPVVAEVTEDLCSGCGYCVAICPYSARVLDERRNLAKIEEVLCQGCGACAIACPSGASRLRNFTRKQIISMVDELI